MVQSETADVSVIIATYHREELLIETVRSLRALKSRPVEIILVDQTPAHEASTERELRRLAEERTVNWIRLSHPSITHAMNVGLREARSDVVLFLDDDIIPGDNLVAAHSLAHQQAGCNIVAGQVLQPGESPSNDHPNRGFKFCSSRRQHISELMGGNFSIKRNLALILGGFDENFVRVAYRFESEFAERAIASGEKILFEPEASIRHLKARSGGTRSFGAHLTTVKPSHSVGEYYYLLRSKTIPERMLKIMSRPFRAIRTRHHLSHPWWIPGTLVAETLGFFWAVMLAMRGPRLISTTSASGTEAR